EETLYDPKLLLDLDFHKSPAKFDPFISAAAPGEPWMKVRPLQDGDFERGFIQLLSQLTDTGKITKTQFLPVTVIEDTRVNQIIGAASLIVERKFIRGCALRARLEDVVVNNTYRGKQLGK
uniref:Glucosamine 6-phosphate N-acetyltransferase n=1 Tax=Megaselia scalaris TaxID=36166 RepID=T1H7G6_MEGSC